MIVETSDSRFFRVTETNDANLTHVWFGHQVKPVKTPFGVKWEIKSTVKDVLVRKAASRVVEA